MNSLISKTIFTLVLMTNLSSYAQSLNKHTKAQDLLSDRAAQSTKMGGVATGGGDICEDRIKSIRDDLKSWIIKGGSKMLQLPEGISDGVYADDMLEQIFSAKVRCVGNGDAGYPVSVSGASKVCRFDRTFSSSLITCDYKKFQMMSESDQYVLIHHEYAGLADIEKPNGSDSDYRVSNQITQNLENVTTKRLAVKSSLSMQDIPKEKLEGYLAAAVSSLKDLQIRIDREQEAQLCKRKAFDTVETTCGYDVPEDFIRYLERYQFGRIGKKGNVTEVEFDLMAVEREKRTIRIVYDQQKIRSIELIVYYWQFPPAVDVSNPPTKKEWVKEGSTTWFKR